MLRKIAASYRCTYIKLNPLRATATNAVQKLKMSVTNGPTFNQFINWQDSNLEIAVTSNQLILITVKSFIFVFFVSK